MSVWIWSTYMNLQKVPLLKKVLDRRGYNLPKNWSKEKWSNILWTDEIKIVLFGSKGHSQFVRWLPNSEFKPQQTVKTVTHGGASMMIWACFSCYGVRTIYCIPGIMDHFAYVKILKEVMLPYAEEDKSPWNGCFSKTLIPNTRVNEQNLCSY